MLTAATVNIFTFSDADYSQSFVMGAQDDATSVVTPFDLTGYKLWMMVRKSAPDNEVFIELSSDDIEEIDISDPVNGAFSVLIERERLERMEEGDYVHSLIMVAPGSELHEDVWRGTLTHAIGPTR